MNAKKSLTLNGLVLPNFIFVIVSTLMILVSAYLTNHYFNLLFPSGVTTSSALCNINSFWGCDKATESQLATLLGMPTSIFGIIIGLIGIIAAFAGTKEIEQTAKTVFMANFIGCLVLFIYSLVELKSLCPMCTVYYVLSLLAVIIFWKHSQLPYKVDAKSGAIFFTLTLIPVLGFNYYLSNKEKDNKNLSISYIAQFKSLKDYGAPAYESPYKIHMATENFADAPIRISVFSDFQCPYCESVAKQMPEIIKEFKDKVNIQYLFYPLDSSCNSKMKGSMHVYACQAAYLAACDANKFAEVHDYIFANQEKINSKNLRIWAKEFGLDESCFENKKIQDLVQQSMNTGEQFSLRSTPTIIINGKKLEGMVPTIHLKSILRSLIK